MIFTPQMESLNLAVDDTESILRTPDGKLRNTAGPSYTALAELVRRRVSGDYTHVIYGPQESINEASLGQVNAAQGILFVTRNADRSVWQIHALQQILAGRRAAGHTAASIVVLASCAPYDLIGLDTDGLQDIGYVASFEFTVKAMAAAAAVIFGEEQATGQVPVSIKSQGSK